MDKPLVFAIAIIITYVAGIITIPQPTQATGGGEVIELVIPILDDATKAVQSGDKDKALALLEEIRNELSNTYFQEEEN